MNDIRCTSCGSDQVIAVRPGTDQWVLDLLDLALVRGEPIRAWCESCWRKAFVRSVEEQPA